MNKNQKRWMVLSWCLVVAGVVMNWFSTPPDTGLKMFIASLILIVTGGIVAVYVETLILSEKIKKLEGDHE